MYYWGRALQQGLLGLSFLLLTGCDQWLLRDYHDPSLKLKRQDYDRLVTPPNAPSKISFEPQPPATAPIPQEVPLSAEFKRPVSLTVTGGMPVRDIFVELARQADISLSVDPQIQTTVSGVFYTAKRKPLIDVVRHLSNLLNLRLHIHEGVLVIEADHPYLITYDLHHLNLIRQSQNRISISTDVFSTPGTSHVGDNGSNSVVTGMTSSDFWVELEHNLKMILLSTGSKRIATLPKISPAPSVNLLPLPGKQEAKPNPSESKPQSSASSSEALLPYTLHKQAGLVSVLGTKKQHALIERYFQKLKDAIATQVVIEAKIVEVILSDDFKSGINWNLIKKDLALQAPFGDLSTPGAFNKTAIPPKDVFTFALTKNDLSSVARLMQQFGTVRTLSNPRLTVLNNQSAMLKVATNQVFFKLDFQHTYAAEGKPDSENTTSSVQTVPIGLVLTVHPSVNKATNQITMTLRPTISRILTNVKDPAVSIKSNQQIESLIPVVQVREMDSVLQMKSGQVIVMGGLMEERARNDLSGLPGADAIPIVGNLMSGREDTREVTELVIFLRAYIIDDQWTSPADERVYHDFTRDPRPLEFS